MKEQTDDGSREMDTLRKNQKEMLETKNTVTEMKAPLMGSSVGLTWPGKESVNLNMCQQKIPGTSLVVQWIELCAPNAGGPGSIPGQGTRSHMHATTREPMSRN